MKTALIVDDSSVARAVLRQTLVESGISVDEAPSAEVAIEYLRSERPDVIFLDHMMPGMDGFEALKTIKANLETATIPVIMYTSQDGQLYMSQARALGAVDVLPKTLKPADVKRLLRSHHLTEDSETTPSVQKAVRDVQRAARDVAETARNVRETEMLELVGSVLHEHRETLLAEMRAQFSRLEKQPVTISPSTATGRQPSELAAFGKNLAVVTIATTFAAALWLGSLYIHTAHLQNEELQQVARNLPAPGAAATRQDSASAPAPLEEITRSVRADLPAQNMARIQHYAFGAIPLDDGRAFEYQALLNDLKDQGFAGAVRLDIFEGRFCLNFTSDGSYELAPMDQPAMSCDRIGTPSETVLSTQQTVLFSNMMAVASRDGQLRIETVFHGPTLPIVGYPDLDYGVTAGEWNAAAAYNQRVALRLANNGFDARSSRIAVIDERDDFDSVMAELAR